MPAQYDAPMVMEICLMHTPFGSPVVPDVYMMKARSSPDDGFASAGLALPAA